MKSVTNSEEQTHQQQTSLWFLTTVLPPFHTAVNINNFAIKQGFDNIKVRGAVTPGLFNIYINLQGREPNGTVSPEEYVTLQQQVTDALSDSWIPTRTIRRAVYLFWIYSRPVPRPERPFVRLSTNRVHGQIPATFRASGCGLQL